MTGRIHKIVPSLIVDGLRQTDAAGLVSGSDLSWLESADERGVPLAPYRAFLEEILVRFGPVPILKAGQTLRTVTHPILFVLLNTASPEILIEKERRLSRFIHSRHHVRIESTLDSGFTLAHVSEEDPPRPTENLASCGQHIVLLEEIGCRNLSLVLPDGSEPESPVYANGRFNAFEGTSGFQTWRFAWSRFEPTRRPMEGLDELLLGSQRDRILREDVDAAAEVEALLLSDLGRTWTVDAVASELGRSSRTLQRQLSAAGHTFTDIVLRTRTAEAARLLQDSRLSITEIGYVCGFADTAHFSRTFKKRFEVSPSLWQRGADPGMTKAHRA